MTALSGFLVTLVLATALAALIALLLKKALFELLIELCGNERRARFWAVFSLAFTVLAALYGVLVSLPPADAGLWADLPNLRFFLAGFRAGLLGLLLALSLIAFVLITSIGRQEEAAGNLREPQSWGSKT